MKKKQQFPTAYDSYRALKVLGEGGSGIVYEVISDAGVQYALKQLRAAQVTTDRARRFKNEISFCENIGHENVVSIIDVGYITEDGRKCPFYVMPLFPKTLRHLMKEGIAPDRVLGIFEKILHGVEAAHLKKVWHRDLKPENILVDESMDRIVVADFGIAHFAPDVSRTTVETQPGDRLANFQYAAPEQKVHGGIVDGRTDIFALGLLLNEMFTGHVLQGVDFKRIGSVSAPHAYLDHVVDRMVTQGKDGRYPSIDDLKKDISVRARQFMARQQLSQLTGSVIDAMKPDDPLLADPVRLTGFDYREETLVFTLNREPNQEWIRAFQDRRVHQTSTPGLCTPNMFQFRSVEAAIQFRAGDERSAQRIVNLFKEYLREANQAYADFKQNQARTRERQEREALQRQIEEAERRNRLLDKLEM